jgi:anti-sigma B factor antagonist
MHVGFETQVHHGWQVLSVRGDVDVETAPLLKERLAEVVGASGARLIVDLDGVDFLDSTGLGVLVDALRRVRSEDGQMRLVCNQPKILRVFEITGLDKIFSIFGSVGEAARGQDSRAEGQ